MTCFNEAPANSPGKAGYLPRSPIFALRRFNEAPANSPGKEPSKCVDRAKEALLQ